MPRTSERGGPQTRARIAAAAGQLFLERGFDAVTVAEIARQAGVSSVTVFNHFPTKEDLFLDRSDDAVALLRSAVRDRPEGTDVLASLHEALVGLVESAHPLTGLDERSAPFFRTLAGSPALVSRARAIAAELERTLVGELARDERFAGDARLLAALVISGYGSVLVETARRRVDGESPSEVVADHRARLERLFEVLRHGFGPLGT